MLDPDRPTDRPTDRLTDTHRPEDADAMSSTHLQKPFSNARRNLTYRGE